MTPFAPGEAKINITARDQYGQPAIGGGGNTSMLVALVGAKPYQATETCQELGCGSYDIPFADITRAGSYGFFLFLQDGENPVEQMGQGTFVVQPGPVSTKSTVEGLSATYVAGARGAFFISARDAFGNQRSVGGNTFSVTVYPTGLASVPNSVEDLFNGVYQVKTLKPIEPKPRMKRE